jgi:hypothetical protein
VSSWITPKARKGISGGISGRGLFAYGLYLVALSQQEYEPGDVVHQPLL